MALETYFDFADNDFQFFKQNYEAGIVANAMGSLAQSICERYMKHIVSELYSPQNVDTQNKMMRVLRTHNLNNLINFLRNSMGIEFSPECETEMRIIDGYYFTTRYPGEDSILLDSRDLSHCMRAVSLCRKETLNICASQ